MMKRKPLLLILLGITMLLGMFGSAASAAEAKGWVRIVHASPDAPNVDVYVNGDAVLKDVPYKAASDYLSLAPGSYDVKVFAAGKNGEGDPVLSATLPVEAGKKVTVAAVNKVAAIELLVLNDDLSASEGKSKIRFVHASPDAPNVDLALKGGDVLVPNAAFKSASAYLEVDPAKYDLEARPAGTADVALAIPGVELKPGTVYTAFAVGLAGGTPALEAWLLTDSTPMPAEMPKSGMGGASETTGTGYTPWALGAIAALAGGALILIKRRAEQS
ncbi:DUF4397 domain-containing protein [Paenibacillus sp. GCM10023252]|uniref:DUF4397 domain-containing protein n=1 Tax=Paenibacillus sp. GCM10023252 TaxID=3252649 RepID=UPI00360D54C1